MALKSLYKVNEAANIDMAAEWTVSTRLTISSQAAVEKALAPSTNHIGLYSDSDVVFRFDLTTGDNVSANNDMILQANTLTFIRVPKGVSALGRGVIYFHAKQVASAATKYLRLVEC